MLKGRKCRNDRRNLTEEWLEKRNRSAVAWNKNDLKNIDASKVDHLLGKNCKKNSIPIFINSLKSFLSTYLRSKMRFILN